MRGDENQQEAMFSYVSLDQRVPTDHPLRAIRKMADQALAELSGHFDALYARRGRPSKPPEQLIRALLLQVLYAIRSERQLMERIRYDLLFRWFVGLGIDEEEWDATVFTKNRDRLMQGEVAQRLLEAVMEQARSKNLLSEEHFTVDGTLLEAWASRKSFVPKDPADVAGTGARGRKCLRDTHESRTDPQARLYKKSTAGESKPSYLGHVMIENRNGLVVAACATQSSARAEREAALAMLDEMGMKPERIPRAAQRITLGADKSYQEQKFIEGLRQRHIVPHVAEYQSSTHWGNFLTEAERNDPGLAVSQKKRKLVERVFGWGKLDSVMRKIKLRGLDRVDWLFRFLVTAHNLVRMMKLIPAQ
ncbi:MAG: IS5 family transposase [Gallionella sp.]|nr:IS5 family transposase [Gallionella sp.]